MIDYISDIITLSRLNKIGSNVKFCFFVENNFIYQYLEPYIKRKNKEDVIIVAFEKLEIGYEEKKILVLKTIFFRSLFFLTLKTKFLITSTPDLDNSFFKKSKYNLTKYIYIQHSPLSLTKIYDEKAFLSFDAVQAVNTFQYNEIKKMNQLYKKKIKPFRSRYLFIEEKISQKKYFVESKILIAPTWHTDFYELNLHIKLKNIFDKEKIDYILRPHPMSLKKREISIKELKQNKINFDINNKLDYKKYSHLITDWSGIFIEYSIINKRPAILINTKQKIRNIKSNKIPDLPIEISARNILGNCLEVKDIKEVKKFIEKINMDKNNIINNFYSENFFN